MRVGEIGCGTIAKLVHNMVSACARLAIAEGLTLGVKAGVAPEALLDALQKSSFGQGRVLKEMIPTSCSPARSTGRTSRSSSCARTWGSPRSWAANTMCR